jgi:hypothetical protein
MWKARRAAYYRRRAAAQARYLDDIALNFSSVVEPMVIELNGETLRLEGSIEDQYDQWQELLARIFEDETGLPAISKPARTASTTTPRR